MDNFFEDFDLIERTPAVATIVLHVGEQKHMEEHYKEVMDFLYTFEEKLDLIIVENKIAVKAAKLQMSTVIAINGFLREYRSSLRVFEYPPST